MSDAKKGEAAERQKATPEQRSDDQARSAAEVDRQLQEADPKREERAESSRPHSLLERGAKAGGGRPVAESSDPLIEQRLAEYETARLNGNEERMAAIAKEIEDAGYEVG